MSYQYTQSITKKFFGFKFKIQITVTPPKSPEPKELRLESLHANLVEKAFYANLKPFVKKAMREDAVLQDFMEMVTEYLFQMGVVNRTSPDILSAQGKFLGSLDPSVVSKVEYHDVIDALERVSSDSFYRVVVRQWLEGNHGATIASVRRSYLDSFDKARTVSESLVSDQNG